MLQKKPVQTKKTNPLNGNRGSILIRRYLAIIGHIVAMVIVLKLAWAGTLNPEYYIAYLAFIAGHTSFERYIERSMPKSTDNTKE
jgi:hypothetical protein